MNSHSPLDLCAGGCVYTASNCNIREAITFIVEKPQYPSCTYIQDDLHHRHIFWYWPRHCQTILYKRLECRGHPPRHLPRHPAQISRSFSRVISPGGRHRYKLHWPRHRSSHQQILKSGPTGKFRWIWLKRDLRDDLS